MVEAKERFDRLHAIDIATGANNHPEPPALLDSKKGIYRRPGKAETRALAVDDSLILKYGEFLKMPGTGIVKLNGDPACISTTIVVEVGGQCSDFAFPGAGAAYSFRTNAYTIPRLADVSLYKDLLVTGGVFQQEFIVDLGDLAIGDITLDHAGLRYLMSLPIVSDSDEYAEFRVKSKDGIDANGFRYRLSLPAKIDSLYAIRSIAYRAEYLRSIDGYKYNELDFDKRRDVIVVFRTVDRDPKGNITILWKVLKDAEAPKLKQKK